MLDMNTNKKKMPADTQPYQHAENVLLMAYKCQKCSEDIEQLMFKYCIKTRKMLQSELKKEKKLTFCLFLAKHI